MYSRSHTTACLHFFKLEPEFASSIIICMQTMGCMIWCFQVPILGYPNEVKCVVVFQNIVHQFVIF
jgi:hypothetical protein